MNATGEALNDAVQVSDAIHKLIDLGFQASPDCQIWNHLFVRLESEVRASSRGGTADNLKLPGVARCVESCGQLGTRSG